MARPLFTPDEANRMLPTVDGLLDRAQHATRAMRDIRDNLVDLRIVWGDQVEDASCPGNAEYETYRGRFRETDATLRGVLAELARLGCQVKDVDQGLVDFPTQHADGVALLCWKRGEDRVAYWHTLTGGFSGRRPIPAV